MGRFNPIQLWVASQVRKRDDKPQLNHDAIKAELTPVKAATTTYKLCMYVFVQPWTKVSILSMLLSWTINNADINPKIKIHVFDSFHMEIIPIA